MVIPGKERRAVDEIGLFTISTAEKRGGMVRVQRGKSGKRPSADKISHLAANRRINRCRAERDRCKKVTGKQRAQCDGREGGDDVN